jgi:hypothetical protein
MPSDDSPQPNNALPNYMPPWLANTRMATIPQGAPGQLSGLARDLAAGGFGNNAANLSWLDKVYDPVKQVQFNSPPPKPKTPTTTGGTGGGKQPGTVGSYTWQGGRLVPGGRNSR